MLQNTGSPNSIRNRHRSNLDKGLYRYVWWSAVRIFILYAITLIPIILVLKYFFDVEAMFAYLTENFSDGFVLTTFFASESFLGLIPPDIFMVWTTKFEDPMAYLFLLGVLSYAGGLISYYIGFGLSLNRRLRKYSERVFNRHETKIKKWGGAFIIMSALFPYSPFSMIVMALSFFHYPLRWFLLYGLSRIARFVVQGIFYMNLVNL